MSESPGTSRRGKHTPLIEQYLEVKSRHPDSLLFFRVGDFYEMFFEDAEEGSGILGLTLTSRNNGGMADVPLAGVPVKAASEYVSRLLRAGRRVAICEQLEDAAEADGIVRRDVVEVITPGTVLEDTLLTDNRNNYVVSIAGTGPYGVAAIDLSTGEFDLTAIDDATTLVDELGRLEPAEIVVPDEKQPFTGSWLVTTRPDWRFDATLGEERLRERFGVRTTAGFGLAAESDGELLAAAAALLTYVDEVRPAGIEHLSPPRVDREGRVMYLDAMTRRNLELVEPLRVGEGTSLLELLDRTRTAMGARLLRRRVLRPLVDRAAIEGRLEAVAELVDDDSARREIRERLGQIRDLERLAARISTGSVNPRELLGLGRSLEALPAVAEALVDLRAGEARRIAQGFDALEDLRDRVISVVEDDPPLTLKDGGVIRRGHSAELDDLRDLRESAVDFIAAMQARERESTGIDSLKVGFNKVFGYYLEVTKANSDRVPDDYTRKQTLTNAERYITPELKEWESKVLGAEDEIVRLETRLFQGLRDEIAGGVERIQRTAKRVAELDVCAGLADVARRESYVRPEIVTAPELEIEGGRHPVVETTVARETFVPNDTVLDEGLRVMIVTGPNMAGKSTVLRQVGLIALMAQMGSFVPADRARVGLCDRVFTRVGASDSLASGMSTFMVEMTETATILNGATERSLVLLDEIGRGTSTYDGVSIAWAVTEHLHGLGARTVFATHYHELVGLADTLERAAPFNVAVKERGSDIVFLHRLEAGGSDRSYGVHVARLAGIPGDVVRRAARILKELEAGPWGVGGRGAGLAERTRDQLSLFAGAPAKIENGHTEPMTMELSRGAEQALGRLAELDLNDMTPLDALNALAELQEMRDD
ncbi:MAG: DNA mismatch repair protein MutS [Gemmatimonadota bacterium]|nr:DNA mismatch repair protein MutS [Gemmatimonadota bacterium]